MDRHLHDLAVKTGVEVFRHSNLYWQHHSIHVQVVLQE